MKKAVALLISLILFLGLAFPSTILAEEYDEVEATTQEQEDESEETTEEVPQYDANGFPLIDSPYAIVMDAETGQILYEKDAYTKAYPAGVTKVMTVLTALEEGTLTDTITMSDNAVWGFDRESSHIALDVGETIQLKDALYAILMVSANEAGIGVAEHIGGSEEFFCTMMNDKAKALGCTGSNFTDVNGFHSEDHYTTAYDLALITRAAMSYDTFLNISACTYYEIPPTNYTDEIRYLWQDNQLLDQSSEYYYGYCNGGKYGYTQEAGGVLTAWATYDDMKLICVTMGASSSAVNYTDTAKLFDFFFYNYYYYSPLADFEFTPEQLTTAQNYLNAFYKCENAGKLTLSTVKDKKILIYHATDTDKLSFSLNLSSDRINQSVIGTLSIQDEDQTYLEVPVSFSGYVNSNDPEAIRGAYANGTLLQIKDNTSKFVISGGVIVLVLILAFFLIPLEKTKKPKQFLYNKLCYLLDNIKSKRR